MSSAPRTLDRGLTARRRVAAIAARVGDYVELTKPRIVLLELIVASVAACLAAPHALDFTTLLHALAATACVAASASVANQLLEKRVDAQMPRTVDRPLPAGRVSSAEAVVLAAFGLIGGIAWLALRVNLLTAALGWACWFLYVVVYTPLKRTTPLNTSVGAVAGAMPMLMGWTATGAELNLTALSLACVLFLWQFPHFMAIAWLYRCDYAAAKIQMSTVVDPTGVRSGVLAVVGAVALIPVSLIPATVPTSGSPLIYALWALGLGGGFFALAVRYALQRDDASARQLLRGSLIYLPAWLVVLLMVTL